MLKYNIQLTDYTNNNQSNKTKVVVSNADDSDNTWYFSPSEKRFELIIEYENITLPIRLTLSVSEMQKALDAIKAVESW